MPWPLLQLLASIFAFIIVFVALNLKKETPKSYLAAATLRSGAFVGWVTALISATLYTNGTYLLIELIIYSLACISSGACIITNSAHYLSHPLVTREEGWFDKIKE